MKISFVKEKVFDLLFPPYAYCLGCDDKRLIDQLDHLCPDCRKALWKNCQAEYSLNLKHIDRCIIPFTYEGVVQKLIHALKYQQIKAGAIPLIQGMTETLAGITNIDWVIPVPLYKSRHRQRGFNQATILCEGLCQITEFPLNYKGLVRIKNTAQQAKLDKAQRKQNVADAFKATEDFAGKSILLVDDVLTTGATASACAKTLKQAGANKIYLMTAAYAPFHDKNE